MHREYRSKRCIGIIKLQLSMHVNYYNYNITLRSVRRFSSVLKISGRKSYNLVIKLFGNNYNESLHCHIQLLNVKI